MSTSIVNCCLSAETVVYNGGLDDFAGIVNSVYSLFSSCFSLCVFTTSVDERVDKRDDVGLDERDDVERVDEQKDERRLNERV